MSLCGLSQTLGDFSVYSYRALQQKFLRASRLHRPENMVGARLPANELATPRIYAVGSATDDSPVPTVAAERFPLLTLLNA